MKKITVTFRNKKTGEIESEVKLSVEEKTPTNTFVFLGLEELKKSNLPLPKVQKCKWSYHEEESFSDRYEKEMNPLPCGCLGLRLQDCI